jgi:2-oxoglutarate dehydrogenase E1 component
LSSPNDPTKPVSAAPSAPLTGLGAAYFDSLYEDYKSDPGRVGGDWSVYFSHLTPAQRRLVEEAIAAREAAARDADDTEGAVPRTAAPTPHTTDSAPRAPETKAEVKVPQAPAAPAAAPSPAAPADGSLQPLRGVAGKIVENMQASLEIPTATTFRNIPVKALEENRRLLNRALEPRGKSKITFTHLVGFALVRALAKHPALNCSFERVNGEPHRRVPGAVHFGLAIDLPGPDGGRSLVVPNVKNAGRLSFPEFCAAVDDVVGRARNGKLAASDFQGTTLTLTNPGTLGTVASVPRLMKGQGAIIATGAIEYSAEAQGMSQATRAALGLSRMMGITSTYDHRVIQGAESGAYLATVHELLAGEHSFYEEIFDALRVPFEPWTLQTDTAAAGSLASVKNNLERAAACSELVQRYRSTGHVYCHLDPLGLAPVRRIPELRADHYNFTVFDLDREFFIGKDLAPATGGFLTLRDALETLRDTYCGTIGFEFEYLTNHVRRAWLRKRAESSPRDDGIDANMKIGLLKRLIEADAFERFLHTRYVGQKRFSLEGADALIPMLDLAFDAAASAGLCEILIGMAHRGRLNVLAHLVGMPLERIFAEFEGVAHGPKGASSGDVKYHLGYEGVYSSSTTGRTIRATLACNPSHLEAVDPVVEGMARAKQDMAGDRARTSILPVLIHGDAAFAGQGVVMETIQMDEIEGYKTGGTLHIIINNQIGYTANPGDSRSTMYCSDLAKAIEAPVVHVNGDDASACARAMRIAFEYRQKFQSDIVIDLVCYRRHGHNEGDEPGFTQPLMVQAIEKHPTPCTVYESELIRTKVVAPGFARAYEASCMERLTAARDAVKNRTWTPPAAPPAVEPASAATACDAKRLVALGIAASSWPEGFTPHAKIERLMRRRRQMLEPTGAPVDFGFGEILAYATLLAEGVPVRLSGEDSGRGTFSHRHSVLHDYKNGNRYVPLNHLGGASRPLEGQAFFEVTDSLLSEEAALGFEYGYSIVRHDPKWNRSMLVIWEAQFGDFANGAQIQIDQFIAAGEAKWGQYSGLVLFLPHGHDGQGPEHSSARPERFLQLCARDNMRVVNVTTASQIFHLLRDQAYRRPPRPLVVMSPKSLLRADAASSPLHDMANGAFRPVLDDPPSASGCARVLLCSGKVYYDLAAERERLQRRDTAILRLEQIYPFPAEELLRAAGAARSAEWVWVQEEPSNMGAAFFAKPRLEEILGRPVHVVARPENPSPASGSTRAHLAELQQLLAAAFAPVR